MKLVGRTGLETVVVVKMVEVGGGSGAEDEVTIGGVAGEDGGEGEVTTEVGSESVGSTGEDDAELGSLITELMGPIMDVTRPGGVCSGGGISTEELEVKAGEDGETLSLAGAEEDADSAGGVVTSVGTGSMTEELSTGGKTTVDDDDVLGTLLAEVLVVGGLEGDVLGDVALDETTVENVV
jgi:hypothetical protein